MWKQARVHPTLPLPSNTQNDSVIVSRKSVESLFDLVGVDELLLLVEFIDLPPLFNVDAVLVKVL